MHPSPDVLALLALGEEAGTRADRDHVESCAQCRTEVAELGRAVAVGRGGRVSDGGLVTPPDRVWAAIRTELGFGGPPAELDRTGHGERGRPEISEVTALPRHARVDSNGSEPEPSAERPRTPEVARLDEARSRPSRGRRGLALLAAAVALVVGVGLGFGLDRLLEPRQTVLWTAELTAEAGFPGSVGRAVVQEDGDGNRTLVVELDSPEPVDGSREVWLIDRGIARTKSIGYLNGDSGQWPIPADVDPQQFPVVDVSKEPPADTDLAHSGSSIVRGTLNV